MRNDRDAHGRGGWKKAARGIDSLQSIAAASSPGGDVSEVGQRREDSSQGLDGGRPCEEMP